MPNDIPQPVPPAEPVPPAHSELADAASELPSANSVELAQSDLASKRRRRQQKLPSWYEPRREDPTLNSEQGGVDQTIRDFIANREHDRRRPPPASMSGVVTALPRRQLQTPDFGMNPLMMPTAERFDASLLRILSRVVLWVMGFLLFQVSVLWDKLLRRDSEKRRAERLLRTMQRIGGTLIKFGQQMAMRVDLLPYAYCVELSKLLDSMPSFPVEHAIAAIERSCGKKLKEVFARFDPEPIGSASIACVYQAVLHSGEMVAVKVRRPGIGKVFAADLRALRWVIGFCEVLALIRPGNLRNLPAELELSFMEELDLRREAYFQEIFRRNSQDRKMTRRSYFSSPRVFFEYSSREVIVEDYVSGIWLWEILSAVEQRNPAALARMEALNIDPKIIANRLMWISLWGNLSNVMFHADPHPANVIVQKDNHIIFIDFGACGYVSSDKRNRFLEFFRCQGLKDVSGMVKATMALLEPLAHIDLNAFEKDLERVYFHCSAALWSKQAAWYERSSASLWLSLMQLTQKYNLPVHSDTVKGLRATLLYDTLALRLNHDLDIIKQSQAFMRDMMAISGKQMRKQLRKRVGSGPQLEDYAKLAELTRMGGHALEQVKRLVDHPPFNFTYSIDKPIYAVITAVQVAALLLVVLAAATGSITGFRLLVGKTASLFTVLAQVLTSRPFQGLSCVAILVGIRRIMFRLQDRDV